MAMLRCKLQEGNVISGDFRAMLDPPRALESGNLLTL